MKGSLLASDHSDKTRLLLEAALKGINKTQKKKKKKLGYDMLQMVFITRS